MSHNSSVNMNSNNNSKNDKILNQDLIDHLGPDSIDKFGRKQSSIVNLRLYNNKDQYK